MYEIRKSNWQAFLLPNSNHLLSKILKMLTIIRSPPLGISERLNNRLKLEPKHQNPSTSNIARAWEALTDEQAGEVITKALDEDVDRVGIDQRTDLCEDATKQLKKHLSAFKYDP
jgi:hypothetical protein